MKNEAINWSEIPEVITKEQLYKICHISKSTALYLIKSGKIPCECSGGKTRCYKIKKEDVITYLKERKVFPESYSAPAGWYKGNYEVKIQGELPLCVLEDIRRYYTELLDQYPDVMTTSAVAVIIGYGTTSINNWCTKKYIKSFKRNNVNHIPKIYLVEFLCSTYFRSITRKSDWHISTLKRFSGWKQIDDIRNSAEQEDPIQSKGVYGNGRIY